MSEAFFIVARSSTLFDDFGPYFFSVALLPNERHGLLILEVSRSHTTTQHSQQDSSGRVISSQQRPLPDNTQHSQQTNLHASGGIRTHNPSRREAADLRLRPRGHWEQQKKFLRRKLSVHLSGKVSRLYIIHDGSNTDIFSVVMYKLPYLSGKAVKTLQTQDRLCKTSSVCWQDNKTTAPALKNGIFCP